MDIESIKKDIQQISIEEKPLNIRLKEILEVIKNNYLPSRTDRKELLIHMASTRFEDCKDEELINMRSYFDWKKHNTNWKYWMLKRRCYICNFWPHHRHHIIQLRYGGNNTHNNMVSLCKYHHEEIHRLAKYRR